MHVLEWLYVIAAVVFLFGASVFVHEYGHMWMARRCGLKVEGFSIGFGPRLFGWTHAGVQYAWRLIPAGGFVSLPQMASSQPAEGAEPLPPASPGARILVAVSGPVMNGIFAFGIAVLIYFVGLPVRVNPPIIGAVEPGSPEAKLGIRAGDRIVAVNGQPVNSWDEVQMTAALAPTNVLPVTILREGTRTTYHLPATVNPSLGLKLLDLEPTEHPVVEQVVAGSPASVAGLKTSDEVLTFAGAPIVGLDQLVGLIKKRPGAASPIEVKRGKERLTLTVTPKPGPSGSGVIGVRFTVSGTAVYELQKPGPLPWTLVAQVCQQTFDTVGALVHSGRTGVQVSDLSGPPGILAMLAVEIKADYRLALKFMVLLNISLGLLNLLPLPVLDGGHVAMAVAELVRGRPLSRRFEEAATVAFATLLICFMVYVSYNDIARRLPLFKALFKEQVQIEPGAPAGNPPPPGR
ncbi:MAG TPA: RIP metalloprotease RseP [Candidatus Acidoferrum sp.]|nr:RIP metalloprotease RseP [Candidatus Acidoferrum sp.]